jgi:hypothetical protein
MMEQIQRSTTQVTNAPVNLSADASEQSLL